MNMDEERERREDVRRRVTEERARQGLGTPALPTGEPEHDAGLAAAYHRTAALLIAARHHDEESERPSDRL